MTEQASGWKIPQARQSIPLAAGSGDSETFASTAFMAASSQDSDHKGHGALPRFRVLPSPAVSETALCDC